MRNKRGQAGKVYVSNRRLIFIMLTAIVTVTFFLKSSPIYPFNDGIDTNAFMTMGRSMLHGKVPYKDLYDHKGPVLYFIYAAAALISETSFIGIWLWEIVACYLFLFFSYKIMEDCNKSLSIAFVPILSAIVYGCGVFYNGGQVEEFSLPIFSYAIYVGLQMLNDEWKLKKDSCLLIGITSGLLFWMKFNLCMFYLGWILVIAFVFIKHHRVKDLLKMCLLILEGIVIVTVPIIIYFAVNNAISALFKVYFYDNIFTYSLTGNITVLQKIYFITTGIEEVFFENTILSICLIIGLIFLFIHSRRKFAFVVFSIFTMSVGIYCGLKTYTYYIIPFSVFTPFVMEAVRNLKLKDNERIFLHKIKLYVIAVSCIVSVIFAYIKSPNVYLLKYKKSDMPQFQFAEIISRVEGATLLEYNCMDLGVYTVCGIVPDCKYYYKPNMVIDELHDMQDEILENGNVDFIVAMGELDTDLYECVCSSDFLHWDGGTEINHYYLYQRVKN